MDTEKLQENVQSTLEGMNILERVRAEIQKRMDAGELSDEQRIEVLKTDLAYQAMADSHIIINDKSLKEIKDEWASKTMMPLFSKIVEETGQVFRENQKG